MGSHSSGSSTSYSNSNTFSSAISQQQLAILKQREQQYQSYFFPEIVNGIKENSVGSSTFNAGVETNANAVNSAFDSSMKSTNQSLAQQGLGGSGVGAALKAANERSRSSSLASAYMQQLSNANTNKVNYLQVAAAMSPTPTSDVAYQTTASSKSNGSSNGWGLLA